MVRRCILRAFAGMFAINTADIAAADGRRHRLNQYLPMARLWNIKFLEFLQVLFPAALPNHFTIHDTFSFIHLFSSYIQWAKWHPDPIAPANHRRPAIETLGLLPGGNCGLPMRCGPYPLLKASPVLPLN